MAAKAKVVRVEETLSPTPGVTSHDDLVQVLACVGDLNEVSSKPKAVQRSQTATSHGTIDSSKALAVSLPQEDAIDDEDKLLEAIEDRDEVFPLPENWPKIPAIFERRSWDFTTAVSPSINKAAAHLDLLQGIIEEWFKEADTYSRVSSRKTVLSRPTTCISEGTARSTAHKRHLRFVNTPSDYTHDRTVASRETLSVFGIGAIGDSEDQQLVIPITRDASSIEEYELPFLGGEEVVEEVITLLAKLENDRHETLEKLRNERARSKLLKSKIDKHCQKRLHNLAKAVQSEHEACAQDIFDLNWHVSFQGRNEEAITRQCENAETVNIKLTDDIEFIKQHIPLVQEKLELEIEAMARIEQAQKDTDDELNIVSRRCAKVQTKSNDAHRKAEEERESIRRDLDNVRSDLARITAELSVAKMNYNSYIHLANEYRQQIQDNEQEVKVLTVKSESARAAEAIQELKVKELQKKVKEAEYEQKKLEEENVELRDTKEWKKNRSQKILEELLAKIEEQKEKLKKLKRTNQELDMDIEDAQFKLNECERQKIADQRNIERMIKELRRTEEQYEATIEELAQMQLLNIATRDQLQAEEDRTLSAEEALRATADALKRQVKEEIHSRTMIAARMNADTDDLETFETETKVKKEKTEKMVSEVEVAVKAVKKKVDKLRNLHRERTKTIADLEKEKTKLQNELQSILDDVAKRKDVLLPSYKEMKEKMAVLQKLIDQMKWKEDMMTKKMEEMSASSAMMDKSISKSTVAIEDLDEELGELDTKLEDARHVDDELQGSLDMINNRNTSTGKHHKDHMKHRNQVLDKHRRDLKYNFQLNTILASQYRKLTNDYLFLKNILLDWYDRNIKAESGIKDMKQLQGLQQKMHSAMDVYYKYRGLYNRGELTRMQIASNGNAVKVGELQSTMENALDTIADFLENQLDGDTIRKMALDKVEREERGEIVSDVASVITASRPGTHLSTAMGFFTEPVH